MHRSAATDCWWLVGYTEAILRESTSALPVICALPPENVVWTGKPYGVASYGLY